MRHAFLASFGVLSLACSVDSSVFGDPVGGVGGASSSSVAVTIGAGGSTSSATATTSTASSSGATASSNAASSVASGTSAVATAASTVAASSSSGGAMAICGNSVVEAEEQCDDGNTGAGDGCGTTCLLEGTPNQCPSGAVIKLTQSITIVGTTSNKNNILKVSCGGQSAGDEAYQIVPTKNGSVTVELATSAVFDRILAVRPGCNYDAGAFVCTDQNTLLTYTVQNAQANVPFHVIITGHNGSSGDYTLRVHY